MTALSALWLPILVSAVVVFFVSSVLHMMVPWHQNDYRRLANEDQVRDALRPLALPPGDYMVPCPTSREQLRAPEFIAKRTEGPNLIMTVLPSGPMPMGTNLALWFLYGVVVALFAAYVTGRALAPGAAYLQVFRFVGVTMFLGYVPALWQMSIWYRRSWATTLKSSVDGLIYALLTAGVFGWLWPR